MNNFLVSVIVPTIGRPDSLRRMLQSLVDQNYKSIEVLVADGSSTNETKSVTDDLCWQQAGLTITRIPVSPPNAVRQRQAAIGQASGEFLLLLDDDVELEAKCVLSMIELLKANPRLVGVFGDFSNQSWPGPTRAWRLYLRLVHGMKNDEWNGRVIGPLLRFGYNPLPKEPAPIEWLGSGNSMIRRSAYEQSGGFSNFFLRRCTVNEDVDLGLKLAKLGSILFCPQARMAHYHAPGGRVRHALVVEDDLYNRFLVLHCTMGKSKVRTLGLVLLFFAIESFSAAYWSIRRIRLNLFWQPLLGRSRALLRIFPMLFQRLDFK